MNILFVADPLASFKIYKDTTFSMMREAQRRGHTVAACEPQHLVWQRGGVVQALVQNIRLTGYAENWFEVTATGTQSLHSFDAIIMRKALWSCSSWIRTRSRSISGLSQR